MFLAVVREKAPQNLKTFRRESLAHAIFIFLTLFALQMVKAAQTAIPVTFGDIHPSLTNVPPDIGDVIAIAAGSPQSVALRRDGTVKVWGTDVNEADYAHEGLTNITAIVAGVAHMAALRADGKVIWRGPGFGGYVGTNVAQIAAGGNSVVLLQRDGEVRRIPLGDGLGRPMPRPLRDVTAIGAGYQHFLAVKSDGTVVCWGRDDYGQCDPPVGLRDVVAVAGGLFHSIALKSDGTVVGWGGIPGAERLGYPEIVPEGLNDVASIAAGIHHNLALKKNGTVVGWGGIGAGGGQVFERLAGCISISACWYNNLVLTTYPVMVSQPQDLAVSFGGSAKVTASVWSGSPVRFQWRRNGQNLSRTTSDSVLFNPASPSHSGAYDVVVSNDSGSLTSRVAVVNVIDSPSVTSERSRLAIAGDDVEFKTEAAGLPPLEVNWYFGFGKNPIGSGSTLLLRNVKSENSGLYFVTASNVAGSARSANASLLVMPRLPAIAWHDGFGLFDNEPFRSDIVSLSLGKSHGVVLYADGTIRSSFTQRGWEITPMLSGIKQVAAGDEFSLALNSEGEIFTWGWYFRQFPGNGRKAKTIGCGSRHGLAVLESGEVVAWGDNSGGQTNVPAGLSEVIAVDGGFQHSMALRSDGTVVVWGNNTYGQRRVPVSATNVIAIDSGDWHCLALKQDGTVIGWGKTTYGQSDVPIGLSNVVAVSAGAERSLALKSDGTVVGWGEGGYFEDLSGVRAIACGYWGGAALIDWPILSKAPISQVVDVNGSATLSVEIQSISQDRFYQWFFEEKGIEGATNATLSISNAQLKDQGTYAVVAANKYGSVRSECFITIAAPPRIEIQPQDTHRWPGDAADLWMLAVGGFPMTFQWYLDGKPILGANDWFFLGHDLQTSDDGIYTVEVKNPFGSVVSRPARLFVYVTPMIVTQPSSQTLTVGENLLVNVWSGGIGDAAFGYKWYRNGQILPGQDSYILSIPNVQLEDSGWYYHSISNLNGTTNTVPFRIEIRTIDGVSLNLKIKIERGGVRLSWPVSLSGYYLESSNSPDSGWIRVETVASSGQDELNRYAIVPRSNAQTYFRIRKDLEAVAP